MIFQIESEPLGLPGLDKSEGILLSPCSLFKLFHAPALCFLAGFLMLSQLSLCLSPLSAMVIIQAEGAALFAGKSGVRAFTRHDFLLNTKLHFQQYITAIVQVGLQRIF